MSLRLVPVSLREARAFIAEHHRHNDPPRGAKAVVGVQDAAGDLRGVGVLSRPVARGSDDGRTAEVTRVATDGARNACSMLYGALARAAWSLGYDRVITYTLAEESGASLRASGWTEDARLEARGPARQWDDPRHAAARPGLFYDPKVPTGPKVRWVKERAA
jgi:hypothetical protein